MSKHWRKTGPRIRLQSNQPSASLCYKTTCMVLMTCLSTYQLLMVLTMHPNGKLNGPLKCRLHTKTVNLQVGSYLSPQWLSLIKNQQSSEEQYIWQRSMRHELATTVYYTPWIFVSYLKLAVLFFHLLSVKVPGTVVEWILVAFFAVTLVTTACKPETRQMLTLFTRHVRQLHQFHSTVI